MLPYIKVYWYTKLEKYTGIQSLRSILVYKVREVYWYTKLEKYTGIQS